LAGVKRVFGVVSLALCLSSPARALDIAAVPDTEIAALYSTFCLKAFPDPSALDKFSKAKGAVVMSPEEVAYFLHQDPGRGWTLRTEQALYVITIEYPPYRTCAVRRMTPSGVSGVKNYLAAVTAYAAAKRGKLGNMPPMKRKGPGGIDISAYYYAMTDSAGKPAETFGVFLTNYHGKVPERFRPDAGSGVGVEVRLVHQLVGPEQAKPENRANTL
jgi:hypothetical protein